MSDGNSESGGVPRNVIPDGPSKDFARALTEVEAVRVQSAHDKADRQAGILEGPPDKYPLPEVAASSGNSPRPTEANLDRLEGLLKVLSSKVGVAKDRAGAVATDLERPISPGTGQTEGAPDTSEAAVITDSPLIGSSLETIINAQNTYPARVKESVRVHQEALPGSSAAIIIEAQKARTAKGETPSTVPPGPSLDTITKAQQAMNEGGVDQVRETDLPRAKATVGPGLTPYAPIPLPAGFTETARKAENGGLPTAPEEGPLAIGEAAGSGASIEGAVDASQGGMVGVGLGEQTVTLEKGGAVNGLGNASSEYSPSVGGVLGGGQNGAVELPGDAQQPLAGQEMPGRGGVIGGAGIGETQSPVGQGTLGGGGAAGPGETQPPAEDNGQNTSEPFNPGGAVLTSPDVLGTQPGDQGRNDQESPPPGAADRNIGNLGKSPNPNELPRGKEDTRDTEPESEVEPEGLTTAPRTPLPPGTDEGSDQEEGDQDRDQAPAPRTYDFYLMDQERGLRAVARERIEKVLQTRTNEGRSTTIRNPLFRLAHAAGNVFRPSFWRRTWVQNTQEYHRVVGSRREAGELRRTNLSLTAGAAELANEEVRRLRNEGKAGVARVAALDQRGGRRLLTDEVVALEGGELRTTIVADVIKNAVDTIRGQINTLRAANPAETFNTALTHLDRDNLESQIQQRLTQVISGFLADRSPANADIRGLLRNLGFEHGDRLNNDQIRMYASNFLENAIALAGEAERAGVAHDFAVAALDSARDERLNSFINIKLARTEWVPETADRFRGIAERLASWTERTRIGGVLTPFTVAGAVGLGWIASRLTGRATHAMNWWVPGLGLAAGVGLKIIKRDLDMTRHYEETQRQLILDENVHTQATDRERYRHEQIALRNLVRYTDLVNGEPENPNPARALSLEALRQNPANPANRDELIRRYGEILARLNYPGESEPTESRYFFWRRPRPAQGAIRYKAGHAEEGKADLVLKSLQIEETLVDAGVTNDRLKSETANARQRLLDNREQQEREFTSFKRRERLKTGLFAGAVGLMGLALGEQGIAMIRRERGDYIGLTHLERGINAVTRRIGGVDAFRAPVTRESFAGLFNRGGGEVTLRNGMRFIAGNDPDHTVMVRDLRDQVVGTGRLSADGSISNLVVGQGLDQGAVENIQRQLENIGYPATLVTSEVSVPSHFELFRQAVAGHKVETIHTPQGYDVSFDGNNGQLTIINPTTHAAVNGMIAPDGTVTFNSAAGVDLDKVQQELQKAGFSGVERVKQSGGTVLDQLHNTPKAELLQRGIIETRKDESLWHRLAHTRLGLKAGVTNREFSHNELTLHMSKDGILTSTPELSGRNIPSNLKNVLPINDTSLIQLVDNTVRSGRVPTTEDIVYVLENHDGTETILKATGAAAKAQIPKELLGPNGQIYGVDRVVMTVLNKDGKILDAQEAFRAGAIPAAFREPIASFEGAGALMPPAKPGSDLIRFTLGREPSTEKLFSLSVQPPHADTAATFPFVVGDRPPLEPLRGASRQQPPAQGNPPGEGEPARVTPRPPAREDTVNEIIGRDQGQGPRDEEALRAVLRGEINDMANATRNQHPDWDEARVEREAVNAVRQVHGLPPLPEAEAAEPSDREQLVDREMEQVRRIHPELINIPDDQLRAGINQSIDRQVSRLQANAGAQGISRAEALQEVLRQRQNDLERTDRLLNGQQQIEQERLQREQAIRGQLTDPGQQAELTERINANNQEAQNRLNELRSEYLMPDLAALAGMNEQDYRRYIETIGTLVAPLAEALGFGTLWNGRMTNEHLSMPELIQSDPAEQERLKQVHLPALRQKLMQVSGINEQQLDSYLDQEASRLGIDRDRLNNILVNAAFRLGIVGRPPRTAAPQPPARPAVIPPAPPAPAAAAAPTVTPAAAPATPLATPAPSTERLDATVEVVDGAEAQSILTKVEVHGVPYKGEMLNQDVLSREGVVPKHKIVVDGTTMWFSDAYKVDEDGRVGVVAYIQDGEKVIPRTFYRSNSQGVWRLLPAYITDLEGNIDWYSKGYGEDSIAVPIAVQKALARLTPDAKPKVEPSNPLLIFAGTARRVGADITYQRGVESEGQKLSGDIYSPDPRKKKPPEMLVLSDPNQVPVFDKVLDSWEQQTSLYGKITVEVFASRDGNLKYMFCRDGLGRAWIGGVETGTPIQSTGVRQSWIDPGDLATPAFEYATPGDDYTGGYGNSALKGGVRNEYGDMFANYLSKVPVIQEYLAVKKKT